MQWRSSWNCGPNVSERGMASLSPTLEASPRLTGCCLYGSACWFLAGRNGSVVASHRLQCLSLSLDLVRRSKAHAAKNRDGRTPALQGVLEQKRGHDRRQRQPVRMHEVAEDSAEKGEGRSVHLYGAFDIPFGGKLTESRSDLGRVGQCRPNSILDLLIDLSIDFFGGVVWDAVTGGGQSHHDHQRRMMREARKPTPAAMATP